ncbi:Splicing factor U2af small subunit A [Linum perenne]
MAEHLASIFGTENDRVNCPFYFKIGAYRCFRLHTPSLASVRRPDMLTPELFEELSKHGHIESLDICDNLANHMVKNRRQQVGNAYVQFREEDHAAAALHSLTGRFYADSTRRMSATDEDIATSCHLKKISRFVSFLFQKENHKFVRQGEDASPQTHHDEVALRGMEAATGRSRAEALLPMIVRMSRGGLQYRFSVLMS